MKRPSLKSPRSPWKSELVSTPSVEGEICPALQEKLGAVHLVGPDVSGLSGREAHHAGRFQGRVGVLEEALAAQDRALDARQDAATRPRSRRSRWCPSRS